jgi:hypothetical protein
MVSPSLEESLAPRRSLVCKFLHYASRLYACTNYFLGRTVRSITPAPSLLEATSWDPRQTKVPSTLAFALSIALASLVADGPREAFSSRALQASHGRFLAGSLPRRRLPSPAPKIRLLRLPRVAPRKIRRMAKRPTVPATATAATTLRCRVPPAITHHRPHLWLSQLPHSNQWPHAITFPMYFALISEFISPSYDICWRFRFIHD